MKIKKIISAVISCVLIGSAAFGVNAIASEDTAQEAEAVSYANADLAEYAEQVAVLVNKERTENGLQPLKVSPALSSAANIRAEELPVSFSHTRPNGTSCFTAISELGITYRAAAENIAYGQRNPESVMNAWMNSSGHRANILNKSMEYIGIGVVYKNGLYYWSQFFAVSDSLSDSSYLPDEGDNIVTSTSSATTTSQPSTTTLQTTTATQPPATVQTTTASQPATTAQTTTVTQPPATVQTTTTTQTTVSFSCTETTPCIIITKPVITIPSSGDCSSIGESAFIIITNGYSECKSIEK